MTDRDDGGPAYPASRKEKLYRTDGTFSWEEATYTGLSLRDWFAGLAMQSEMETTFGDMTPEAASAFAEAAGERGHTVEQHLAFNAYKIADAMLEARKK